MPKRSESGPVALSYAQGSLWFLEEFSGGFGAYNVPVLLRLRGALDGSLLRTSLLGVISRHESLRTRFNSSGGVPVQVIDAEGRLAWAEDDLTGLHAEALRRAEEEACRPFDLVAGPLVRATLYRLSSDEHLLCIVIHHIVFDGWSVGILLRELAACYEGQPLSSLPIQYADYAVWQRSLFQGEALARSLAYWKERLQGPLPVLELATDHARPAAQTFRGGQVCRRMGRDLTDLLRTFSQRESVTLFVTLLSGWAALLHRYTGQEDIITGSAIAGRTRAELEGLIGFFVNTLALRLDLSGDPGFRTLLRRMQQLALEVYEHQETPFETLVAAVQPERGLSRSPLFQVMFVFHNTPAPMIQFSGVEGCVEEIHNGGAKFDLTFAITDSPEGFWLALEYNADLFEASTVERMLDHYETFLAGATAQPEERISALPLLTATERKLILDDWNATTRPYPRTSTLGVLFAEQASLTPDNVAVEFEGTRVTYRELNGRANRLAHYLQGLGVGSEVMVGLCAERSLEMVVATLGIIKAGGAYVPLDPEYPSPRLSYMIEDTRAPVVLVQRKLLDRLPPSDARYVCLDDESEYSRFPDAEPESGAMAESLAYVMYTSGSTGQPKGVCIPHRAVARLVLNTDYLQLGPNDRVAQAANTAFDAATFEIWGPLLTGGCIVVMPRSVSLDAREMAAFFRAERITAIFLTTALFNQVAQQAPDAFATLRCVLFGGEQVDPRWVRAILQGGSPERLLHVYGPTETTTFATWHRVEEVHEEAKTVPIGRPISNTTLYVLDRALQPVPAGVPGELYIGGDGLARGYLHSPEMTAARFVPAPFAEAGGARLYKTGDRVRYLAGGSIEFMGRIDFQVKMRGFRIELGEIETILSRHESVAEALVLMREDAPGDKRLVAYVVPRAGARIDAASLRAFVRGQLPDYMTPSAFVALDAFPLTPNGKVDRRALPAPEREAFAATAGAMVEPRTDVERAVADIWREALKIDRLCIHDNFFDLGGHSLLATQVISKTNDAFSVAVPLRALFETQTVCGLAERISALLAAKRGVADDVAARSGDPCIVVLQSEGTKTPFFCATGAGAVAGYYGTIASCFAGDRPFCGIQDPRLDEEYESFPAIEDLARRFIEAIRTVQAKGPYLLGGWSFGGIVAVEMAQQLRQQGEEVAFLGLIDTGAPRRNADASRVPVGRVWNLAKNLLRRGRTLVTMRRTMAGYAYDGARLAIAALCGRRDPAISHLRPMDYLHWARHDLSTQHDLTLAGLAETGAQRSRLMLIHEPFVWHVFKTTRARGQAMADYVATPYAGRITLLRAESGILEMYDYDTTLGWGRIANQGVDVRIIPGNHTVMLRKPYVETLARQLRQCLDAVSPQRPEPATES